MSVIYDGKKIIPAPFASYYKEYQTTEDGTVVGSNFVITLKGTIVADRGSPKTDGSFWQLSDYPPDESISLNAKLGAIIRKQEALRGLFSVPGKTLEFQSENGSPPFKCNPRFQRIDFQEGGQGRVSWVDKCDWVATFSADALYINGAAVSEDTGDLTTYKISRANEEWAIETADERTGTYRLTHSVSAVGKRFYDEDGTLQREAWAQARLYVLNKIGLGLVPARMEATGVLNATALQAFNYLRTQSINELGGTFQVTETWLCYDPGDEPPAVHEYTVNTRTSTEGRVSVSVDGSITGLEKRDNSTHSLISSRWTNALAKWSDHVQPSLYATAVSISGVSLNTEALNTSIGKNPVSGTISYQSEFDNRPSADIDGAISESITVSNDNAADVYASIPVLGRLAGPVLQSIGSRTSRRRTISIEVVKRAKSQSYTPTAPDTDAIVLALQPVGTVFLDSDNESWNPYSGRYSRNSVFTWQ